MTTLSKIFKKLYDAIKKLPSVVLSDFKKSIDPSSETQEEWQDRQCKPQN